jgi:hypothetical protein
MVDIIKHYGGGDFKFCFLPSCFPFLAIGSYFQSGGYSMNNTEFYKRYYSPQFSETASITVRRLSWALGLHMTKTVELMVQLMPSLISPSKVCLSCKDKSKCNAAYLWYDILQRLIHTAAKRNSAHGSVRFNHLVKNAVQFYHAEQLSFNNLFLYSTKIKILP